MADKLLIARFDGSDEAFVAMGVKPAAGRRGHRQPDVSLRHLPQPFDGTSQEGRGSWADKSPMEGGVFCHVVIAVLVVDCARKAVERGAEFDDMGVGQRAESSDCQFRFDQTPEVVKVLQVLPGHRSNCDASLWLGKKQAFGLQEAECFSDWDGGNAEHFDERVNDDSLSWSQFALYDHGADAVGKNGWHGGSESWWVAVGWRQQMLGSVFDVLSSHL